MMLIGAGRPRRTTSSDSILSSFRPGFAPNNKGRSEQIVTRTALPPSLFHLLADKLEVFSHRSQFVLGPVLLMH